MSVFWAASCDTFKGRLPVPARRFSDMEAAMPLPAICYGFSLIAFVVLDTV
jgi:hypothetical protein